jgi:biopolymer transport protein ExbB
VRAAVLAAVTLERWPRGAFAQAASDPPRPRRAAQPHAGPRRRPAPVATTESIENPYGLEALWKQGDFVASGTLIILCIMSMGSWYIIFTKLYEQRKLMRAPMRSARPSGRPAR